VIFEDKHLLVVNKPAGMVVHPGAATGDDTLVHALLAHCAGGLSGVGGVERPGIVHRLDRDTTGVIVVAKSDKAHRGLAGQFSARSLQKEYLALVSGVPSLLSGSVRKAIGRNQQHRHKMTVVDDEDAAGRMRIRTGRWWRVSAISPRWFAARSTPAAPTRFGVHMKALGHVLLGDVVYGWKADSRLPKPPQRVMLHAEHLVVVHPITHKTLDLRAPLPADFEAQLVQLRKLAQRETKARRRSDPAIKSRKKVAPPLVSHPRITPVASVGFLAPRDAAAGLPLTQGLRGQPVTGDCTANGGIR
jgi:23S rRNA pseudouridine1911/1915/1917 synthase